MNLFERMAIELLREETSSERLKESTPEQRKQIKEIKRNLSDFFINSGIKVGNEKHGEDFRLQVQNSPVDKNWIDIALKNMGYNANIIEIAGGETDSKSRSLPTLKIVTSIGSRIYIVLSGFGKKTNKKEFSPNKFNIEGKDYKYKELYNELVKKIPEKGFDKNVQNYLLYLLDLVANKESVKSGNMFKINKGDFDESLVADSDKKNIQNDFGEILGAIMLSKYEKDIIFFPKSSNEPLIDYEIGNIRYSAKSISGAAPTLTSIANSYYDFVKNDLDIPEDDNVLLKIFDLIKGNISVEQTYLAITKIIDDNSWEALLELLNVDDVDTNKKSCLQLIKDKLDEYYDDGNLYNKLTTFYDKIGTTPFTPISKYDQNASWRHGYVIAALAYQIPKILNKDEEIIENMKEVISQNENVRQINMYNNSKDLSFKITNFDKNINIKFVGGGSVQGPNHQNLRFKIS